MSGIFISYRRDDAAAHAGRIHDHLADRFGSERVFFDRTTLAPGADFASRIEESVASAAAIVVVIGKGWLSCHREDGQPRLDDPNDLVRREIAIGLKRGIPLFPVLVAGARLPTRDELPAELSDICRYQAHELTETDFRHDLDSVMEALQIALAPPAAPRPSPQVYVAGPTIKRKVCMVGAYGVGKTSLVARFVSSLFSDRYLSTVGVKIDKKIVSSGGCNVMLMLWDLAGEDDANPIRLAHVRDAAGYILVVDGLRSRTLDVADSLRRRVLETAGPVPFVVAANKADLRDDWQIEDTDLAALFADAPVFQTSAKSGQRVEEMFLNLAARILPTDDVE
jgi:small GTP-binding protein